jgi:hypothetical protein
MGLFIKKSADGNSASIHGGKGINGKPFDGSKMVNKDKERSYSHFEAKKVGKNYVLGKDSLKRAPGVPRGRDIKKASR